MNIVKGAIVWIVLLVYFALFVLPWTACYRLAHGEWPWQ